MSSTLNVIQIIFYSLGILFLITFMIIGIWSFIIYNKMYRSKRVENYILEKIYQCIQQKNITQTQNELGFDINSILEDDDLFNENNAQSKNPMHKE